MSATPLIKRFLRFMKMKWKHRKDRKHRKAKDQFSKSIGEKCRLVCTRIEQNDDHTQIIRTVKFRNSFKCSVKQK